MIAESLRFTLLRITRLTAQVLENVPATAAGGSLRATREGLGLLSWGGGAGWVAVLSVGAAGAVLVAETGAAGVTCRGVSECGECLSLMCEWRRAGFKHGRLTEGLSRLR